MNAVRLAFGTLTVLPVRAPTVDRETAGRAMVLAPLVGLVLALVASLPLLLADVSPLLAAALAVGVLALLTRGLHLDGLADTADGLGSGRPASGALEVMRKSDIGPFGVVTLVLVLLIQVAALAQLVTEGHGAAARVAAVVTSRLALPLACLRRVPSARPDGLGATVVGSVTGAMAAVAVVLGLVFVVGAAVLAGAPVVAVAAPAGLLAGLLLGGHAVRRFGGVTGDVLGAVVEATFTASLVLLSLV